MFFLYVMLGLILMLAMGFFFQANRKSLFHSRVHKRFNEHPDGQKLHKIMQYHEDEQLRGAMFEKQVQILEFGYQRGLTASDTTQAMISALVKMSK
ncbi:MAG: hypothetical protein V7782_02255 [Psychromonas sp.]